MTPRRSPSSDRIGAHSTSRVRSPYLRSLLESKCGDSYASRTCHIDVHIRKVEVKADREASRTFTSVRERAVWYASELASSGSEMRMLLVVVRVHSSAFSWSKK